MVINKIPLFTIFKIAVIWILSDIGYYLLPLLGLRTSYNDHPIWIALYYTFWVFISIFLFWNDFKGWEPVRSWRSAGIFMVMFITILVMFSYFIMPGLPPVIWTESWDPPDLMVANPWYLLPKAIEIFLQQLLISVLVISFLRNKFDIRIISIICMALFGGAHFFLALNKLPIEYVVRFIVSATAFGYLFPRIIVRPNGFLYSYGLHWFYYVITIIMAHTVSPYAG